MRNVFIAVCLLLLAPVAQAANLAGLWVGYYAYDPAVNPARVECAVVFEQIGTEIGGTMIERQTFGDSLNPGMPAGAGGIVDGNNVLFEKYYYDDDDDAPVVVYTMQLSPDGNTMTGFWRIGEASGTAFLRRVTGHSADRIPAPR